AQRDRDEHAASAAGADLEALYGEQSGVDVALEVSPVVDAGEVDDVLLDAEVHARLPQQDGDLVGPLGGRRAAEPGRVLIGHAVLKDVIELNPDASVGEPAVERVVRGRAPPVVDA